MSSLPPPKARRGIAAGRAFGAIFLALFGAFWASFLAFSLDPAGRAALLFVIGAVAAALCVGSVRLLRGASRLPSGASEEGRARGKALGRRFFLVFAAEAAAIAVAANLLGSAGLPEFVPHAIALIVGLHFVPLAALFGVRLYYLTGALIAAVSTVALVALLSGITLGGPFGWSVVGLATAAILWASALAVLRAGETLLRR